jgi:hypothetical protein
VRPVIISPTDNLAFDPRSKRSEARDQRTPNSPGDCEAQRLTAWTLLAHFIRRSLARASIGGDEAVGSA